MPNNRSPPRRPTNRAHDPHRASTGSLPQTSAESYYGAPVAPAPPPLHNYGRGPYSTNPGSSRSSNESLPYYHNSVPNTPGFAPIGGGYPQHSGVAQAPAPPPMSAPAPPPGGMRGGDGGPVHNRGGLARRNTQSDRQPHPTIIHQYHKPAPPQEYGHEPHPELDYRSNPPRPAPVNTRRSRSSSRSRDLSPPSSAGGPFVVLPSASTTGRTQSAYHSGSSNFSGGSYEMYDQYDRQQAYVAPNASHAPGNPREYHLDGPLPGEREREYGRGTVYHPTGGNRHVLEERQQRQQQRQPRRERSRSRGPHHGLGLDTRSGDGSDEHYDEPSVYSSRQGGRRIASSANVNEKGALVRTRSRSVPASDSRALMRKAPSSESSESSSSASGSQPERGIRLEYGGQSVDITYTGRGGKPMNIGSITINTTSRSTAAPPTNQQRAIGPAPSVTPPPTTAAIMPPPTTATATAIAPAPAPLALVSQAPAPPPAPPAPPVQPVMIPPMPAPAPYIPAGVEPLVLPPPPLPPLLSPLAGAMLPLRTEPESNNRRYNNDKDFLYRNMENLAFDPSPYYQERGRDRAMAPVSGPREASQRRRSISRHRKSNDANEPRWTKISRDIVARRAVEVFGYDFKEQSDSIMVFQVLSEGQIDELIELSEKIRSGAVRVIRRERSPKREEGGRDRHHHRRPSQHRQSKPRPVSIHGYPSGVGPGPGPSANRPPPGKPAIITPTAPDPPRAEAPAPPPLKQAPRRPVENPDQPGTYIGYSRNPPRSTATSMPSRHAGAKR